LKVPTGTIVKKQNGTIVSELRTHEQKFIAARGGLGENMRSGVRDADVSLHRKFNFFFFLKVAKEITIFSPI
jgi:hypothetical protein